MIAIKDESLVPIGDGFGQLTRACLQNYEAGTLVA